MATAKKLPSGQWRVQVYSHTEIIDGKPKKSEKVLQLTPKKKLSLWLRSLLLIKKELFNL